MIGEVGLAGELRSVGQMELRLREAAKLGFRRAIVPRRAIGAFADDAGRGSAPSTLYVETLPNGREHEIVEISDAEQKVR